MKNSFAKIDISKAEKTQDIIQIINALKIKLDNTVGVLLNQSTVPNYKYLMTYLLGNSGVTLCVNNENIYSEYLDLGKRLASAGVIELQDYQNFYVEFKDNTLGTFIDDHMENNQLIISGSDIRYKKSDKGKSIPWSFLDDNVKVYVNRVELTNSDIQEFHRRQMEESIEKLKELGIIVDDNDVFIIK